MLKMSALQLKIVFALIAVTVPTASAKVAASSIQRSAGPERANDCSASAAVPRGSTRVYIALRNGKDGSGSSWADARDGSTAGAFDAILRCYSEGCNNANDGKKSVPRTEKLIVCLAPGTFSTLGAYDYVAGVPHRTAQGFTIGSGWRIHGAGRDKTILKLADYLPTTKESNPYELPLNTAIGLVFGTNSDGVAGTEISDLTIDGNYPELKTRARQHGIIALTLDAIHLRSDQGGHWIHDVRVINTAGEIGGINIKWEAFPVWIVSMNNPSPTESGGNIIENVIMSQSFGETGCAIAIANVLAEVRHNQVAGYPIGYGGWKMGPVYFHDNTATETGYGFNIDSLNNAGVRIESNQIIHPQKYGIVVGGGAAFSNFRILNNTIRIDRPGVIGLLFQGNVTGATVAGNAFIAENAQAARSTAMRIASPRGSSDASRNNTYQANQIAAGMKTVFEPGRTKSQNCFFANHDELGRPRPDLADNHNGSCSDAMPQQK
jgi:hypothetical protein